jgi:peroxiredoxin
MKAIGVESGTTRAVDEERCAAPSLSGERSNGAARGGGANIQPIRRGGPLQVGLGTVITAVWIILKYLLVPVLYIPYKLGIPTCWAYRLDAYVRRTVLPLTESPDENLRQDVSPRISTGEVIPDIAVKQRGESVSVRDVAKGHALLLIVHRGSWCSYSRLHLADLAEKYNEFKNSGVEMLAVSAQRDERWWRSKGVHLPLAGDRQGVLFEALGIKCPQSLQQRVWGTLVPLESVFLFDSSRKLMACDIRNVSNTKMKQQFLSAKKWLEISQR